MIMVQGEILVMWPFGPMRGGILMYVSYYGYRDI